jgi:hypothetical protein
MKYRAGILVMALGAITLPAVAEEIIYFKNGSSLAIRGHKVTEGMIHVDMGEDAFIGFPMSMVDRVEEAGKDVYVSPSSPSELKRNQMTGLSADETSRVTSSYRRSADARRDYDDPAGRPSRDNIKVDEHGMAYVNAFPNSTGARGAVRVIGREMNPPVNRDPSKGLIGTRRVGMRQVLGEMVPEGANKRGAALIRPNLTPQAPYDPSRAREGREQGAQGRPEDDAGADTGEESSGDD